MRSSHFFGWLEHLKGTNHEIWWLDVYDGGTVVESLNWVYQVVNWKRRWDFPGRQRLKHYSSLYKIVSKINDRDLDVKLPELIETIKPDVIHSFAMQVSCKPVISVMEKYVNLPWIYSSWGSDVFMSEERGIDDATFVRIVKRITHHISDCNRDRLFLTLKGFSGTSFDIIPGNGGIKMDDLAVDTDKARDIILIKGYDDTVGRGMVILEALANTDKYLLVNYNIIIYGASQRMINFSASQGLERNINIKLIPRSTPIPQKALFNLMAQSIIHIGNSISDGMPNSMLEAMAHGVFPIQSNPGGASAEIIKHKINGLLIENPESPDEIREHLSYALNNSLLIENARIINSSIIERVYEWNVVHPRILGIYDSIKP